MPHCIRSRQVGDSLSRVSLREIIPIKCIFFS